MIPNATTVKIGEDLEVQTAAEAPSRTYKIDFDAGRVGGFCDETEAMKQAIYKIIQTERFAYLIYSWNYGIELDAVVGKSYGSRCSRGNRSGCRAAPSPPCSPAIGPATRTG